MRYLSRITLPSVLQHGYRAGRWLTLAGLCLASPAGAAVLPDDRSDLMYHYYDGGGVTVKGPALLVRKSVGDSVSLSGRYYVDAVSSASIDVITTASPYKDERVEYGVSVDYLRGNSLMSLSYSNSEENDYLADTYSLNVSHEFFGGLTTANIGYSQGHDTVMRVDNDFKDSIDRYQFRLGVSQIVTRRLLVGLSYESVSEEGYLNSPYRSVRILGASQYEVYPRTRDSHAIALRAIMGFGSEVRPLVRSVRAEYRYFSDTWGIDANTITLALQQYFGERWTGELRYRNYQQSAAIFYSDNFSAPMTYMARDKELSTFSSNSIGAKVTWNFSNRKFLFFNRMNLNFSHDYVNFDYQDFTDVRTGQPYSFGANILQLYVSAWY